jgi:hypothetical protein
MEIDTPKDDDDETKFPAKEVLMEFPHPRFNAQMTVQGDQLFIYGGTFEKGDREYTLDELYALDLGKLDGVKQIFRREVDNWLGSEDEESDEEGDSEDEDDEEEEEEEEEDVPMTDAKPLHSESKRKAKRKELVDSDNISTITSPPESVFDDTPDDATKATQEDDRPHPRPFESRRDFFQRTGNEWQELLMTGLRWKGIKPETLSVKEIKTKAFEMSEEKWWDCREEITALEDEQDAAGIGEVVTLADRAEASGGVGRRR